MHIYGPTHLHGASPINPPHTPRVSQPESTQSSAPIQDELHLSEAALRMEQIHEMPSIRQDRVAQIRAQLANGTYETPEKLNTALERLLDEIG
jgi:negative regulator of flagellin synthesis FlgM